VAWLLEEAERRPVLAVWEDLHWADPSTLEFLGLLVDQAPTAPILSVLTFRREFVPPWPARSHMTPLTLNRLERPQVEAMIGHLAAGKALPPEVVDHIVARTDGVPLFVEELTKMLLESDRLREEADHYALAGPLSAFGIPATLQDSLMARLDRVPGAREVAQLGAVLGREFSYEMLKELASVEETTLQERLAQLVNAELFYQRGRPPRARYFFKHALIQDAAYGSLLRSTRQHYHQRIARLFEDQFPDLVETQPELVAHHFTEAGCHEQAVDYWQRAGQRAVEHSAYAEAVNHLTKGLELVAKLPETPQRNRHEIAFQFDLGNALQTIRGRAAPEVGQTYARARELSLKVGDTSQLYQASWGLRFFHLLRGDYGKGLELAEELLSLAEEQNEPELLLQAHEALSTTLFYLGEFRLTLEHARKGSELYNAVDDPSGSFRLIQDPGVLLLVYESFALGLLGHLDQSRQKMQEALGLAEQRAHPHTVAVVLSHANFLHMMLREPNPALENAERMVSFASEHGFSQWLAAAHINRGWALAQQGSHELGIPLMLKGKEEWEATGAELAVPFWNTMVAEAFGRIGRIEEGLRLVDAASALTERNDERWAEAWLDQIKGELLRALDSEHQAEAEDCFQHAIAVARGQQAKWWELRAAMSLSRLWQRQGKKDEARELLAEIYGWFTEGFDHAVLKEAKALLGELTA
jgi:predicted ATPase